MDQQANKYIARKFNDLIARSKDSQAYSDFKEGVNEGLDLARYIFDDNADKFNLSDIDEDRDTEIKELQDRYNSLIDRIEIKKKPKHSEEELEGIREGLEESKALFGEFIKGFI